MDKPIVTVEQIKKDLRDLGVKKGDIVMLHASLSQIGYVEGGADAVLDAVLDVLGEEGTLMVPTFTYSYDLREGAEAFDKTSTPSCGNGILADTLWQRKEAFRSDHPAYSVAAVGTQAEEMTGGHPMEQPVGEGSPLHRLVEKGGYVLLLGVGQDRNTLVHTAECLAGAGYTHIPYKESWGRNVRVKTPEGEKIIPQTEFSGCSFEFNVLEPLLQQKGRVKLGLVGQAESQLVLAKDLVQTVLEALKEKPDILLCEREDCEACKNRRNYLKKHRKV